MPGACTGIRVLDVSRDIAGAMATMVLADFGADVVRVESVDLERADDPARLFLHRGKRSIDLDVDSVAGRDELHRLARNADVLVESLGAGRAARAGIGFDDLAPENPALVYCSITGFGPTGPLAEAKADDGLVMGKVGVFRDQQGWLHDGRRRPVFRSCRDASYLAGMLALQGVIAALRARDLTGEGQLVETSMLQALTWRLNPLVRWLLRAGEEPPLGGGYSIEPPPPADPEASRTSQLTSLLVPCKDGRWIIHQLFERNFFPSWINVLGFDWIWQDDRFKGAPHDIPDPGARVELARRLEERMREKTATEWMELYVANGNVCADVVQTTEEALHHPQIVEGDYLVELDDPRVGRVVQIGPLAKMPDAPALVRQPAPHPGEHSDVVRREEVPTRVSRPATGVTLAGPLDGITVVEAASFYATPAGTALLADLGARVIKVEPVTGDAYRRAVRGGMGHDNLVRAMQGKENIAVDLKDPRGQEIVHRLVERADVFVHNNRLGVAERLGIDYETLRTVNPRLVYLYGASYGSVGPYRRQPAIDHVIAAFAGTTARQAGAGNSPLKEQGADPVAAAGTAAAILLGVLARDRTGAAQYVEPAMIMSSLYMNFEGAFSYAGKPARPVVDHEQFGTGATYRLYETAPVGPGVRAKPYENPEPRWVFLSAGADDEFERLCRVAGRDDLATDPRFATRDARDEHRASLEIELEDVFRARTAHEWEASLLDAGVGCVIADAMSQFAFMYKDPQARALGVMVASEHPSFGGAYWRHAPVVRFSKTPARPGAYCESGEHTREILRELGYPDPDVGALHDAGVVTSAARGTERAMPA